MHKCFKCGAEFDGKFCPECGTQWQENKHCPNCGAMLAGGAKFCNNCGYSFVGKKEPSKVGAFFKKVWLWIKRHAKVVIPTACALIVVIVVCSLIPTFILMGVNGTYYGYTFDENGKMVFNEKNFVTLSTGKWTDSDGNEGTYSRSGKNVTLKYHDQAAEDLGDMFGEEVPTEVELAATVENGLLIISNGVREEIYAKQSHEHDYGEWEVTKEPTCTVEGEQRHTCACRKVETEAVAPTGHEMNEDYICTVCGVQFTKGLIYSVSDDHCAVIGIGTASGDIVMPDYYEGKPVISISEGAFRDCSSLTSVTIPNSVTSIGHRAFEDCSRLTNITIPNNVTEIGHGAFYNCSGLTSITIPNSVTGIWWSTFYGCSSLTSITIPDSVTSIEDSAFHGCSSLETITVSENNPNYATQDGILYNKDKTEFIHIPKAIKGAVTIPDGVTSIGESAFTYCSGLTSITIPDSVTSIGDSAFHGCPSLETITVSEKNPNYASQDGILYNKNKTKFICIPEAIKGTVTIPNGVTSIGKSAFTYCSGLTSITIPDSVTSIGESAFTYCSGLTIYCEATSEPSGWRSDWNSNRPVVWDCKNNDKDKNGYVYTVIDGLRFSLKDGVATVTRQPSNIVTATIPASVEYKGFAYPVVSISAYAFAGCSGLTSITIGNGVTSIGNSAFHGCSSLTSVNITNLTAWCNISFYDYDTNPLNYAQNLYLNNELVTDLIIPNSVTSIGEQAFIGCSSLTSITIGDGVTSIGSSAFEGCSLLTSITIGNSVTFIGERAFAYCSKCTSVTVANGNTKYHSNGNCLIETNSKTLIFGCKNSIIPTDGSVTSIKSDAFYGCKGLTNVTIPNSVTSIGDQAFANCSSLTSITIPDSVTSIRQNTFYDCSGLTSITIGNGVTSIAWHAFYGCSGLTSIIFNGTMAQWEAIEKGTWDYTGNYTVQCTDGKLDKNGNEVA